MTQMNNESGKQSLDDLLKELPQEIAPKRDLWPGIEQAIAKVPQQTSAANDDKFKGWHKVAAAFAPVALVAGIYLNQAPSQVETPEWLMPVTAGFEMQKRQLLKQVSNDVVLSNNWQTSLMELEKAEQSLKRALIEQPEDPALMKMLNQVYQQQLDLIKKAHAPQFTQI